MRIKEALRKASRDALLRVVRATDDEFSLQLVDKTNAHARSLVGHLEDWCERDNMFGLLACDPQDACGPIVDAAWRRLVRRYGMARAAEIVQRAAKECLGKKP